LKMDAIVDHKDRQHMSKFPFELSSALDLQF